MRPEHLTPEVPGLCTQVVTGMGSEPALWGREAPSHASCTQITDTVSGHVVSPPWYAQAGTESLSLHVRSGGPHTSQSRQTGLLTLEGPGLHVCTAVAPLTATHDGQAFSVFASSFQRGH